MADEGTADQILALYLSEDICALLSREIDNRHHRLHGLEELHGNPLEILRLRSRRQTKHNAQHRSIRLPVS